MLRFLWLRQTADQNENNESSIARNSCVGNEAATTFGTLGLIASILGGESD